MPIEVHPASEITDFYPVDDRTAEEKFGKYMAPYFEIEVVDRRDAFLQGQAGIVLGQSRSFFDKRLVKSVEFEEDVESADQIKITILNPELRLSNSTIFTHGNSVDLFMGYDNRPRMFMGRGIITEVIKDYNDSEPTIVVTGHDISYFMMEEQKAEIVPDGSRWYRSRSAPRTSEVGARVAEHLRRANTLGSIYTPSVDFSPLILYDEHLAIEEDYLDLSEGIEDLRARQRRFINEGNDPADSVATSSLPPEEIIEEDTREIISNNSEMERFGRRRDAGHVWSGLSDSDIVAEIFHKYNVIPYVEEILEGRHRARRVGVGGEQGIYNLPTIDIVGTIYGSIYSPSDTFSPLILYNRQNTRISENDGRYASIAPNDGDPADANSEGGSRSRDGIYNMPTTDIVGNLATPFEQDISEDVAFLISELETQSDVSSGDNPERPSGESSRRRVVQRAGTTDWDFIQELAKKHGFLCFTFFDYETRHWIGYWGPEENIPQNREFIFRYNAGAFTSLKAFRPSSSTRNQSTEIDLIYVDPVTRRENRLRVDMQQGAEAPGSTSDEEENPDPLGTGPEVVLEVNGQRSMVHANHRFTSAEDARLWLVAYWRRYAADFQVVEGETVIGIPELRARQYHIFEGVLRDSGRYFVTYARHTMGDGAYSSTFTCRKTPTPAEDNSEVTVESEELNRHEVDPTTALPSNVA